MIGAAGVITSNVGKSTSSPEEWFCRSISARFDCMEAYNRYRNYLLPRWGGSYDALLNFGCDSAETKRFDTEVPWNLVSCVFAAVKEGHDLKSVQEMQGKLANERVERLLKLSLEEYGKRKPIQLTRYKCIQACYLQTIGKAELARKTLQDMKDEELNPWVATDSHVDYSAILGRPVKSGKKSDESNDAQKGANNF